MTPFEAEQALLAKEIDDVVPLESGTFESGKHMNDVFKVLYADGSQGLYKPMQGERRLLLVPEVPTIRRGTFWMREVATSRLDKMLMFHLVPTTTIWNDGPHGPGSLQEWVEGATPARIDRSRRPVGYSPSDSQRMGVLDYIAGAGDRQRDNYLTGPDGRPVGIDNGCTFPTPTRLPIRFPIRSDFTALHVREELNPQVIQEVRSPEPEVVRRMVLGCGLGEKAADSAVARLFEVQLRGMITGEAWSKLIIDSHFRPARTRADIVAEARRARQAEWLRQTQGLADIEEPTEDVPEHCRDEDELELR